ncbi:MAG: hypothetical protein GXP33_01515, partial [Spirochaetes bacterium]|nr:hypothetical protein [Spirochaetota bacterium]
MTASTGCQAKDAYKTRRRKTLMVKGINHITLSVQDIEKTFRFYKDVLKLKPVMKSQKSCYFIAGDTWIAFVLEQKKQERRLYSHIAFNCNKAELQSFK